MTDLSVATSTLPSERFDRRAIGIDQAVCLKTVITLKIHNGPIQNRTTHTGRSGFRIKRPVASLVQKQLNLLNIIQSIGHFRADRPFQDISFVVIAKFVSSKCHFSISLKVSVRRGADNLLRAVQTDVDIAVVELVSE
jgi:hypothetical protein